MFKTELPILELIVRATCFYFILFAGLRMMPRRTLGKIGPSDLVFILLLVEPAARSLGDTSSILDAVIQIFYVVILHVSINKLTLKSTIVKRMVERSPLLIVDEGVMILDAMRRESLSEDELMGKLRECGVERLCDVKQAFIEADGEISIIKA